MKTKRFTWISLLLLGGLSVGCQQQPEAVPNPVNLVYEKTPFQRVPDLEKGDSELSYRSTVVVDASTNTKLGQTVFNDDVTINLASLRPVIEAFMKANPDHSLYVRLEVREPVADARAGQPLRVGPVRDFRLGGEGSAVGGVAISAQGGINSWEAFVAEMGKHPMDVVASRLRVRTQPYVLMLSVYDFDRFRADLPSAGAAFDAATAPTYAQGGSRLAYRGWQLQ